MLEPHPDDLVIGCGGLVQRLVDQGVKVHRLLLADVPQRYRKIYDESGSYHSYTGDQRMKEADEADRVLGVASRAVAFPSDWHHQLDALPAATLIQAIEGRLVEVRADLVLVPVRSYNQDHRAVFDAFQAVMQPHFYRGGGPGVRDNDGAGFRAELGRAALL